MPFPVPSRDDLTAQIAADQQVRIPGADTTLRFSTLGILAKVWAGALALVWGFLGRYWAAQFFIDSAESPYLERRVAPYGITPNPPLPASGLFIFTGTNGIPIPSGTVLTTPPTVTPSVQYTTQATVTISGTTAPPVTILATGGGVDGFGNGAAGNQNAGATLMLYTGVAGIAPAGTVGTGGLTGGADPETDSSLRARGIARQSRPPQGGAWFDYVAWVKNNYPGATRVWVYPLKRGPGTVDVTFVMDGREDIVPLSGDVAAVQALLNNLRPVTADVLVWAPATAALSVVIASMVPGDSITQTNVTLQVNALARTVAPGGAIYGDGVSPTSPGGYLYQEQIDEAINAAGNIVSFDLTTPSADIVYGTGTIPATPSITF